MLSSGEIKKLLSKYLNNTCTPEERALLLDELAAANINLEQAIDEYIASETGQAALSAKQSAAILQHILGHPARQRGAGMRRIAISVAAAAVLFVALLQIKRVISPPPVKETSYTIVTTARGEQLAFTMPDSTKVWLSADSKIIYRFGVTDKVREVTLSGEAYFEVAPDAHRPFKVLCKKAMVEVLGTAFNISGYAQDSVLRTTLLSGSIKLHSGNQQQLVYPGYTVSISNQREAIRIARADTAQVMAWRSGQIIFDNADLSTVMNTISLWYNVDVEYRGVMPKKYFLGLVDRKVGLPMMIAFLEENGVHTRLEGRKLTILPGGI
ncbi:FecR family protein [Chitinophaga polysaccharea]|uniref:FecR family protein n=1 Tax=Chitinophaga polysaccharea TaxID=1293035 RepID=A0A561PGV3_9BACT|nr:FecR family protein [Chitinophaga polysaccharea]TWF37339.1 FecR family protein [Chitinophaga polysaccharea]